MISRRRILVDVPDQSARFIVLRNRGATRNQFESLADAIEFARQYANEEPLISDYLGNKYKVFIDRHVEQIGIPGDKRGGFPELKNALPGDGLEGLGCPECNSKMSLGRSRTLGTLGICPACLIAMAL